MGKKVDVASDSYIGVYVICKRCNIFMVSKGYKIHSFLGTVYEKFECPKCKLKVFVGRYH